MLYEICRDAAHNTYSVLVTLTDREHEAARGIPAPPPEGLAGNLLWGPKVTKTVQYGGTCFDGYERVNVACLAQFQTEIDAEIVRQDAARF